MVGGVRGVIPWPKLVRRGRGAVLGAPIPWFAGSKRKGLSWAFVIAPTPPLAPQVPGPPAGTVL